MLLKTHTDHISKATTLAASAASSKATNLSYTALRFDVYASSLEESEVLVSVTGSDGDIWVSVNFPAFLDDVSLLEKFKDEFENSEKVHVVSFSVPSTLASSLLKDLPSQDLELKIKDDNIEVSCAGVFNLKRLASNLELTVPQAPETQVSLRAQTLGSALASAASVCSKDSSQSVLTGILMETKGEALHLVATDSFRLFKQEVPLATKTVLKALLPARTGQLFSKLFSSGVVELAADQTLVSFSSMNATLLSRQISGSFPAWQDLLLKPVPSQVSLASSQVVPVLRRIGRFSEAVLVTFNPENSEIEFSASSDLGSASASLSLEIPLEQSLRLSFSIEYLQAGFVLFNDVDSITLSFDNERSPVRLQNDTRLYIAMPRSG